MIDSNIRTLIDELDELRQARSDAFQVPQTDGEFLYQIALATGSKVIVEVGSSYGNGLEWTVKLPHGEKRSTSN